MMVRHHHEVETTLSVCRPLLISARENLAVSDVTKYPQTANYSFADITKKLGLRWTWVRSPMIPFPVRY